MRRAHFYAAAAPLRRRYTLLETARLNGVNPQAWLARVLERIPDYKINRIDGLRAGGKARSWRLNSSGRSRQTLTVGKT